MPLGEVVMTTLVSFKFKLLYFGCYYTILLVPIIVEKKKIGSVFNKYFLLVPKIRSNTVKYG